MKTVSRGDRESSFSYLYPASFSYPLLWFLFIFLIVTTTGSYNTSSASTGSGHELGAAEGQHESKSDLETLKEREAQLQGIMDNTQAVIYLKNTQGRYLFVNHRFEELFKISRDKIVGMTDYDIVSKDMADQFTANDRKVLETGVPLRVEEPALFDGKRYTYLSLKFPVLDDKGVIYAVGGISVDITEYKQTKN